MNRFFTALGEACVCLVFVLGFWLSVLTGSWDEHEEEADEIPPPE